MGYHPRDHPGGRAAVRGRTEDVDSAVGSLIHGPSERGSSRKLGFRQILFSETRMQPRNEPLRAGPSLTSLHINCPLDTSVREKSSGGGLPPRVISLATLTARVKGRIEHTLLDGGE